MIKLSKKSKNERKTEKIIKKKESNNDDTNINIDKIQNK